MIELGGIPAGAAARDRQLLSLVKTGQEPSRLQREGNAADPLALRPRGCAFSESRSFLESRGCDGHLLGDHEHHPDKEVFGVLEVTVGLRDLRPAVTVLAVELEGDARE